MPWTPSWSIAIAAAAGVLVGSGLTNYHHVGRLLPISSATSPETPAGPARSAGRVEPTAPRPATSAKAIADDIKKGGFILYFRHPQRQKWDSVIAFDVFEMATGTPSDEASYRDAVCLTPQGREEAKMIGKIFGLAQIPVDAIASSPSCRARQGAELAFGKVGNVSVGLAHSPVTNPDNAQEFSDELKRVLTTIRVESGKNAVIFAHGNTLENSKHLFREGTEHLTSSPITETGFFVIKRAPDGSLRIVHKFQNLGDFAANAISLRVPK